jgi:DNA-binding PadR family transcriptional regulator
MLELAILGLLRDREQHGYELKKRLGALLGPWSGVSSGSLYPALGRLEARGAVTAVEHAGADLATPMTGALSGEVAAYRAERRSARDGRDRSARGGRNRKVYAITDTGEQRLHELLTEPGDHNRARDDDRSFALRVAFCRHLAPTERLALFERRREHLRARLAQQSNAPTDDRFVRSVRDHDHRTITRDLDWLEQLIADEHTHVEDAERATA